MYAEPLAVVDRIIDGMDLQFTAVTGACIHLPYRKASAEASSDSLLQLGSDLFYLSRHFLWKRLGHYACTEYLTKYPYHRSCPEYDWLKLLLQSGKSGTILPGIACSRPSQFTLEGSLTMHRFTSPFGPAWSQ